MANLRLHSLQDTKLMAQMLAEEILSKGPFALLLHGPLGCGKTTLSTAIVQALPGGSSAEVSSPSFTLCNAYPTTPQVLHCDLYRCGPTKLPEEVEELLEDNDTVLIVEWADYLVPEDIPCDFMDSFF